jgi:hypothetical protein
MQTTRPAPGRFDTRNLGSIKAVVSRIPLALRKGSGKAVRKANATKSYDDYLIARESAIEAQQQAQAHPMRQYLQNFKVPAKTINSKERTRKFSAEMAMACYQDMINTANELPEGMAYHAKLVATMQAVCSASAERIPQIEPPLWAEFSAPEYLESCLLKMQSEKWWARKLARLRKLHLETLEIIAGNVGRRVSPYASKRAISEFIRDKAAQRRWAESLVLVNEQGDELELIKAMDASTANPENARAELMKRIRGLEEYAESLGFGAVFLTMTAPSRMHPGAKNWDGSTPKDVSAYLVKTWSKARAKLKREEIDYFGVRVSEPHQDSTPHWHVILFMPKHQIKKACRFIRAHFCKTDIDELMKRFKRRKELRQLYRKARQIWGFKKSQGLKVAEPRKFYMPFQPRFDVELIDLQKGSAAAYIAKYISKNINGFEVADLIDKETGKTLGDGVMNVKTWASTWNIRQFQFQGCDPITAYREIRRIREAFTGENMAELEQLRQAAESNDFVDFIKAMKQISVELQYDVIECGNEYGETVKKLKGIAAGAGEVITRAQKWEMKRRAALKVGDSQQSWTCGTNCTQLRPDEKPDLKAEKAGFNTEAQALLRRGYTVNLAGDKYRMRYGAISLVGRDDFEPKHPPSKPLKQPTTEGFKPLWH